MKGLEHPAVTAFGATTIIVLTMLAPLASPLHHELYHLYGPPSDLIFPVLLNFAGVWIVLALLLAGGVRFRWLGVCLWCILGVFLPWMLMQDWFSLARGSMSRPANTVFLVLLFVAVAILLAMRSVALPLLHHGRQFATVMLGFAALNGALILAQIFGAAGSRDGWICQDRCIGRPSLQRVIARAKARAMARAMARTMAASSGSCSTNSRTGRSTNTATLISNYLPSTGLLPFPPCLHALCPPGISQILSFHR